MTKKMHKADMAGFQTLAYNEDCCTIPRKFQSLEFIPLHPTL
uniref:Uncharacterized protein n=1 Tax=Rhizophora mucronata TaxID=61149 RepID=A0A2P2Q8N1_RHIMU